MQNRSELLFVLSRKFTDSGRRIIAVRNVRVLFARGRRATEKALFFGRDAHAIDTGHFPEVIEIFASTSVGRFDSCLS